MFTIAGVSCCIQSVSTVHSYADQTQIPGFVRAMAPRLRQENIRLNCLCPGFVATNLTANLQSLVPDEYLTAMSNILHAHERFLYGDETGRVAEISRDQIYMHEQPEYSDRSQKWVVDNIADLKSKAQAPSNG